MIGVEATIIGSIGENESIDGNWGTWCNTGLFELLKGWSLMWLSWAVDNMEDKGGKHGFLVGWILEGGVEGCKALFGVCKCIIWYKSYVVDWWEDRIIESYVIKYEK